MTTNELNSLIEEHGKSIYSFCCYLTKSKQDADDLYQDTFVKVFEKSEEIDYNINPKSYILSIAIGIWKNNRKKLFRRLTIAPTEECEDVMNENFSIATEKSSEDYIIDKELITTLKNEANKLSDKLKLTFYLYYTSQLSIHTISQVLKIPEGTVKTRLLKARKVLKKRLEEQGYEV